MGTVPVAIGLVLAILYYSFALSIPGQQEYTDLGHRSLMDHHVELVDGILVRSEQQGKEIFLVYNGTRHLIPDFETFVKMKFQAKQVKAIHELIFNRIPLGEPLKSLIGNDEPVADLLFSSEHIDKNLNPHHLRGESLRRKKIESKAIINTTTYSELHKFSLAIEQTTSFGCFRDDYSAARDDLIKNRWASTIPVEYPALVYPMCLRTYQLGNSLGYYLNELACADLANAHFIGTRKHFEILDVNGIATTEDDQYAFFDALPDIIVHQNPELDRKNLVNNLKTRCDCTKFCWQNERAPWIQRVDYVGDIFRKAADAYLQAADISKGTALDSSSDLSNFEKIRNQGIVSSQFLPIIPNVTIQYRCGDNIGFGRTHYGLMPFKAFVDRIKHNAEQRSSREDANQYIYIIADSPTRASTHPYASRCGVILKALFAHLQEYFPKSVIIIKRGGDVFLDVARLTFSQVVICSASTFCLWPAISNPNIAYFPLTPLAAGAYDNETAPFISKRFNWIKDVEMIKEFKRFHPWEKLIDVLVGKDV